MKSIVLKKISKVGIWQAFCEGTKVDVTVERKLSFEGKGYTISWRTILGAAMQRSANTLREAREIIDLEILG